jgi:hypothetical protein
MYKHIKTFSISRNSPIFQNYKNERFWTSSEFMNYIREKRERMNREYGRDIWEKISNEKIYQSVQGFLSDDTGNGNGNETLENSIDGGENKIKIKDDTVFQDYERYERKDDDETIYFDDSG